MVFVSSLFTGMAVLVARFAGADDPEKVNRTVVQAMITAAIPSVAVLAPIGWFAAPALLDLVNAEPAVQAEALPFLRLMFVASIGMMMFFMLGGALRAAGDAQTPLRLGIAMTVLNIALNLVLIPGFGPIPRLGTTGAAIGTNLAGTLVSGYAIYRLWKGDWVISVRGLSWRPDWSIIRALFRFGLPTGVQGVAMNVAGVLLVRFIGSLERSAEAQAAYAVGYTELFSLITWTSVGLMGASAAYAGQNLGAGHPDRAVEGVRVATRIGLGVSVIVAIMFLTMPRLLLAAFGMTDPAVVDIGVQLLTFLSIGPVHLRRPGAYGRVAGHGRHAGTTLHLDRLADHRAVRHLYDRRVDTRVAAVRHLERDPGWARDAVPVERSTVQAGEVARYSCRNRTGKNIDVRCER
jgi:putative MATE family efflux protein